MADRTVAGPVGPGSPAPALAGRAALPTRERRRGRTLATGLRRHRYLYLMLVLPLAYFTIFRFYPILGNVIAVLGFEKVPFFQVPFLFQLIVVASTILKESGWAAVIYLAAISSIDPQLYEAAQIDGANRWQLMRHVTLPGLATVIMTLLLLQLGWFLNVGFAQLFILQNNIVLPAGDIIETFIYRVGIQRARFDFTTAAGLFNSAIGLVLVVAADRIAKRMGMRGIL